MSGSEVRCPPPGQRRVYTLKWGGEGGVELVEWRCPACGFVASSRVEAETQKLADEHVCTAGWCAVTYRADVEPAQLPSSVHERYVARAHRKRYGAPR